MWSEGLSWNSVYETFSNIELQEEVADVCGDSVSSFEELLKRVEDEIEDTNE